MLTTRYRSVVLVVLAAFLFVTPPRSDAANALERYIEQPDDTFAWHIETQTTLDSFTVTQLTMTSQTWHGHVWSHGLQKPRRPSIRSP